MIAEIMASNKAFAGLTHPESSLLAGIAGSATFSIGFRKARILLALYTAPGNLTSAFAVPAMQTQNTLIR